MSQLMSSLLSFLVTIYNIFTRLIIKNMKKNKIYSLGFMGYLSHDPAACLMCSDEDGNIKYIHFEEGMLSRKKKSYQFPLRAINECLNYFGIKLSDVDIVTIDYMNSKCYYNTSNYYRKLIGDYIRANLDIREDQLCITDSHHKAHAYTAFYPSGFKDSAVLSIDGLGTLQETHSIYLANKSGIESIYTQRGSGIGMLYSLITYSLGFDVGEEGKTMGLAPYGEKYNNMDSQLPSLKGNYSGFCVDYSHIMQRSPDPKLLINIDRCGSKEDIYTPYYSRLAFNIQNELERCLIHICTEIKKRTGAKNLCIAGGIGLNCVANEIIRKSNIFDNVFVQPSSGDTGISLGLSMIGIEREYEKKMGRKISWGKNLKSFWRYSPVNFDKSVLTSILKKYHIPIHKTDTNKIAKSLANGKIVSYFEKGWEFGPRALGHRSFLADPRSKKMKETMNKKIKHRELYRPFAPIIMEQYFSNYFDSPVPTNSDMLYAVTCKLKAIQQVPSVVHIDNTARVQTCTKSSGKIFEILSSFHDTTNVPILINTSLNDNNEPIVMTPIDALSCFLRTSSDILVVDNITINRSEIPKIDKLLHEATKIQKKYIFNNSVDSINKLLTKSSKKEDPISFLNRNLLSSLYFKNNYSLDMLQNFLFSDEKLLQGKTLITDDYHHNIIKTLQNYNKRKIVFNEVLILKDEWSSLKKIPKDAYVILYNCSAYLDNSEVTNMLPILSTCSSFYTSSQKKADLNTINIDHNDIVSKLKNTYEIDSSKSIDELFYDFVTPAFIDKYL